jgi:hypothetical protein
MKSTALPCLVLAAPLVAIACVSVDDRTLTSTGATGAGGGAAGSTGTGGQRDASSDVSAGGGGNGGGAAGGTGGSAASGGTCALPASPGYELFDDMENGNGWIPATRGRNGRWFTVWGTADAAVGYLDTGLTVIRPLRPTSGDFILRWAGGGYTWGSLTADLAVAANGSATPYDLGRYVGLRLSARGPGDLRIAIPSKQTTDQSHGGTCTGTGCDDAYSKLVPLTAVWQSFSIAFCDMRQQGLGTAVPLDLHNIFSVSFAPKDPNLTFDFSVDDIELILPTATGSTDAGPDAGVTTSMIDDMEDGNDQILLPRTGNWYVFKDGASDASITPSGPVTMSDVTPARDGSTKAVHVTVAGSEGLGAGFGVLLNVVAGTARRYDASAWDGIQFWMKGSDGKGANFPIAIAMPTLETLPGTWGGSCDMEGGADCYNFATAFRRVGATWTLVTVPFASLGPKWGWTRAFDPKKIVEIEFSATDATASDGFDVWVDDIAFYKAK